MEEDHVTETKNEITVLKDGVGYYAGRVEMTVNSSGIYGEVIAQDNLPLAYTYMVSDLVYLIGDAYGLNKVIVKGNGEIIKAFDYHVYATEVKVGSIACNLQSAHFSNHIHWSELNEYQKVLASGAIGRLWFKFLGR